MATKTEKPIVAELGRPETPEETAARKAESSRLYRMRKTLGNLLGSLAVCALAVLVLVAIVPRDDSPIVRDIDYVEIAQTAQVGISQPLTTPQLPDGWTSNEAQLRTGPDGIVEWYIGFIRSDAEGNAIEFVGVSQGIDANATWVTDRVDRRPSTGEVVIDGYTWTAYDHTHLPPDQTGNTAYSLVLVYDGSTFVIYGSRSAESVQAVAEAVTAQLP